MPGPLTPNIGLQPPTVGGDLNLWGGELNSDLAIIDQMGALQVITATGSFTVLPNACPFTYVRVINGLFPVIVGLPPPATIPNGKVFIVKKVDAGPGATSITAAAGIDGQPTWVRQQQWSFLSMVGVGTAYEIIGGN